MRRAWREFVPARVRRAARRGLDALNCARELERRNDEIQHLRRRLNASVRKRASEVDDAYLVLDWPRAELRLAPASGKRTKAWEKEPFTVDWIEHHLAHGEVLYDIGANAGTYSLIAATVQPEARVVAFEPSFATFALLCENIHLNGLGDRIAPIPLPLGASTTLATFRYTSIAPGAASHNPAETEAKDVVYEQPMLVHSLDDLIQRFALPAPNHLKLDVDGQELNVLRGAVSAITSPSLRTMMVELGPDEAAVREFLEGLGVTLRRRYEKEQAGMVAYGLFARQTLA
jgi:FkbM family methyltransferase